MPDKEPILVEADDKFTACELADEKQILSQDPKVREDLVYYYKLTNEYLVSGTGVKWCVQQMAKKGEPIVFTQPPKTWLEKYNSEDTSKWVWQSECVVRNNKTGLETYGQSESPFIDPFKHVYDKFGRTKAGSKAERNANRKQIPEADLIRMINIAIKGGAAKPIETKTPPPAQRVSPTPAQVNEYKRLIFKHNILNEVTPSSKDGMSARISAIVAKHGE